MWLPRLDACSGLTFLFTMLDPFGEEPATMNGDLFQVRLVELLPLHCKLISVLKQFQNDPL